MARFRDFAWAGALVMALGVASAGQAGAGQKTAPGTSTGQSPQNQSSQNPGSSNQSSQNPDGGFVIEPAELPVTYPQGPYQVHLHVRGDYVPVLRWKVTAGSLPPGITLEDNGMLRGEAQRAGEFQFVVQVRDGGQPQQGVQKGFVIKVMDGITAAWKVPAHVTGNRIDGSVEVTNATSDDMDLTFDVKAVAENGRATEIGYQHFPLKKGTIGMALPFGETLPHGGYVIYVNVVGEVAKRNAIYKQQMKTPGALQVVVGP